LSVWYSLSPADFSPVDFSPEDIGALKLAVFLGGILLLG
jgi:hypothetical protein